MRNRQYKTRGISVVETLVVLSIVATVAALATPEIAKAKRDAYVLQCKAQMQEIGAAIIQYRNDHNGKMPHPWLDDLVPKYISEDKLVCPLVKHVASDTVECLKKKSALKRWTSFFYFSPILLDNLAAKQEGRASFSDILKQRGSDTPMLVCRDHREPSSLDEWLAARNAAVPPPGLPAIKCPYPLWCYPEDDIVVLRWDGRVDTTKKGGTKTHRTSVGALADLLEL